MSLDSCCFLLGDRVNEGIGEGGGLKWCQGGYKTKGYQFWTPLDTEEIGFF